MGGVAAPRAALRTRIAASYLGSGYNRTRGYIGGSHPENLQRLRPNPLYLTHCHHPSPNLYQNLTDSDPSTILIVSKLTLCE
jgi:hypothetical protein